MTNTPAATRATPHAVDQLRLSGFAIASTADAATCMAFRAGFVSTNDIYSFGAKHGRKHDELRVRSWFERRAAPGRAAHLCQ